ncbi:hypothetical protein [Novosphingobium sp. AAP83]|uniref:hypothetical protein n=1 Tax=Novosphingobium sp. AAP83 TaxID=1523425 RepID=UPI0009E75C35|nr:hypothetical protein [Novosphingobium sp. AAP83]
MSRRFVLLALALLVALAGGGLFWQRNASKGDAGQNQAAQQPLGLFTSLPILWGEHADLRDVLAEPSNSHSAKSVLEHHGKVVALDTLADLSRFDRLIMAQPRPLMPEENVALDGWVRAGGRALVFADPMLTQDSAFALGDKRRPQDVVLISPILGRWGLELRFDDAQTLGVRENAGEGVPVNLPGQFAIRTGGVDARCKIGPERLIARCRIGKGRVLLVADAALLEADDDQGVLADRLDTLLTESFGD